MTTQSAAETMTTMAMVSDMTTLIAECAYFKAERRGFAPGFELDDWLAAETEVLAKPAAKAAAKPKRPRKNGAAKKD